MSATVETSIGEQLKALIRLQAVDSKIDQVKKLRGDLPEEILQVGGGTPQVKEAWATCCPPILGDVDFKWDSGVSAECWHFFLESGATAGWETTRGV